MYGVLRYAPQICNMYGVPRYLQFKDLMEQGFRYEKDCLSKKERTTCIGNGNSGENPNRFNEERTKKGLRVVSSQPMQITLRNRLVLQFVRYKPVVCQNVKIKQVDYPVTVEVGTEHFCSCGIV